MTNPHPTRFLELLADADGPTLDCGSGGRSLPGVVSIDLFWAPENTVTADATALPFPEDTFALVLSQAVLEHVPDPAAYINEIVRVLRPGGLLYIEVAFLQPVHASPSHYFGVSPPGLRHLCAALEEKELGTVGSMADSWDWIGTEAGARSVLGAVEFAKVRASMAKVDAVMTPERALVVASGVTGLFRKP